MKRILIHIPVGAACAVLGIRIPLLAVFFFILWVIYELNEDFHLKDQAWKDIPGFMIGIFLVYIIQYIIQ